MIAERVIKKNLNSVFCKNDVSHFEIWHDFTKNMQILFKKHEKKIPNLKDRIEHKSVLKTF